MKNAETIMAAFFNCCLVEKNNLFTETKLFLVFKRGKPIISALFSTTKLGKDKKSLHIKSV